MSEIVRTPVNYRLSAYDFPDPFSSSPRERRYSSDERGTATKDAEGDMHGGQHAASDKEDAGRAQSRRLALFEQRLRQAKNDQSFSSRDNEEDSEKAVEQLLFETARATQPKAGPALPSSSSGLEGRIERIFREVAIRVDAAIRPGPAVTTGPVKINIPLEKSDTGLTRIQVTVADNMVVIKLCFPASSGTADAGEQLLAAASQLGQLLQAHLPGRRIRIVRSTPAADDTQTKARAGAASGGNAAWPSIPAGEETPDNA